MNSENNRKSWGAALKEFALLLTVIFTALRACGAIDWAWYWVLSPLIIKSVLVCVLSVFTVCAIHATQK